MESIKEQIKMIALGTQDIFSLPALEKKLSQKKSLTIKFGADPTAPDLHLGHATVLSKLRQLQDLGHTIIFLIGDFTSRIGDPTGRSKTRPALTEEQIAENSKTYLAQVGKVLDISKCIIRYNAEWLDKLSLKDWITICGQVTVAQIIEREDFSKRLQEKTPIGLHELMYPLVQGYDSIALNADVEFGGTDQTFNLLMGRHLQEARHLEGQVCITMPLLEGLDGKLKMSKSYGNAIGLTEPAEEAFGKLMSISDTLMWRYYTLLLMTPDEDLLVMQKNVQTGNLHPMDAKKDMAYKIIKRFWSCDQAEAALKKFEDLFQKRDYSQAQEISIEPKEYTIVDVIKLLPENLSSSEIRRRIQAGAISVNGEKIETHSCLIIVKKDMIIKVGKHSIYKIV